MKPTQNAHAFVHERALFGTTLRADTQTHREIKIPLEEEGRYQHIVIDSRQSIRIKSRVRGPSLVNRLGRFAQRHRIGIANLLGALAAGTTSLAVMFGILDDAGTVTRLAAGTATGLVSYGLTLNACLRGIGPLLPQASESPPIQTPLAATVYP